MIENIIEIDWGKGNHTGIIYFLLNLPLVYISLRRFGGDFIIKTIFCVICYSVLLSIVPVPEKVFCLKISLHVLQVEFFVV
ncbi:YitT family protein [Megamonas funiformis]|uniref:YitT family protein n=1 Tax=Megamonas funiformis TaxID=437897 RepID=UPI003BA0E513